MLGAEFLGHSSRKIFKKSWQYYYQLINFERDGDEILFEGQVGAHRYSLYTVHHGLIVPLHHIIQLLR
jgi:hypothetical protein